jgi:alcohol dehydrogenase (NADP+)
MLKGPQEESMTACNGYASFAAKGPLAPHSFERRDPGPNDIVIAIDYCGICHSDIHMVNNDWGSSVYPMVPGHEIVGRVSKTGSGVKKFREGDLVGVGCMVDSCRVCENCRAGEQQFCTAGMTLTYSSPEKQTGKLTYGGYSTSIVVDQDFVLRITHKNSLAAVAPLLCAGITTYSPLRHWKVGPGKKVGVVGLGGLGHMALKLARSMGAEVVQFTTSAGKREDALRLGAHEVVLAGDRAAMHAEAGSFDFILDTVSAAHDLNQYLNLLRRDANLVLVGAPAAALPVLSFALLSGRRSLSGSMIGGIAETQEMLDYCAEHQIVSDIELTPIQKVNDAFERVLKSDVKYRFVIDMASIKS